MVVEMEDPMVVDQMLHQTLEVAAVAAAQVAEPLAEETALEEQWLLNNQNKLEEYGV
jgi:hypothetical protein